MKTHVNLLPAHHQQRNFVRRCLGRWCVAWIATGVLIAGWYVFERFQFQTLSNRLAARQAECQPIDKLQQRNTELEQQMAEFYEREKLTLGLANQKPVLLSLAAVSRAARASGQRLYVQRWSMARNEGPASKLDSNAANCLLRLNGLGADNLAVSQFVNALNDSGAFLRIELTSSGSQSIGNRSVRAYQIECLF